MRPRFLKPGLWLLLSGSILFLASRDHPADGPAFTKDRNSAHSASDRPAKASDRSRGNLAAGTLTSEAAAAEIRRMCLDAEPGHSLETFQHLYDHRRLLRLVGQLGLQDVRRLRADPELLARQTNDPDLAKAAMDLLEERFGELAPAEVLTLDTYNSLVGDSFFRALEYTSFLTGAAKSDPDAAVAFWKEHLRDLKEEGGSDLPFSISSLLRFILEGAAMTDPDKAWEIMGQMDPSSRSALVLSGYFGALPPGSDWNQAIGQLESCKLATQPGSISAPALALAQSWMKDDPASALQWLDSINGDLQEARRGSLARINESNTHLAARASVYAEALQPWLYTDPLEALHWLRAWQPADVSRLEVIREAMNGTAPVFERELLAIVESPEERAQLFLALARDARGSEDFDTLLAAGGIPEETTAELRRMKDRFGSYDDDR
ncbi:hypothetical protein [Luteolibacter sp. Populi]|uniref:hypothetical protein n=1 Tax=Luteolibacter sp. Populi TaxID=3230487 RepID=UPI003467CA28